MNLAIDNKNTELQAFEPVETSDAGLGDHNTGGRDISAIAIALLLLDVKLDNIEDGFTARGEKRELQNRVKACNDNVVANLRSESLLNTAGPILILIFSSFIATQGFGQAKAYISDQAAASLASAASQIGMPLITGTDQALYMTEKERHDREKQMTEQELQTTHAQAQSARDSFNQDLKRAVETVLNS